MQYHRGPIGKIDPQKKITIIGAGISGLCLGHYLKKKGLKFEILEKEGRVGGKLESFEAEHGLVEKAANAVYANDDVLALLNDLDLAPISPTKGLRRKVWLDGKAKTFPFKFSFLLHILLGLFKKPPSLSDKMTVYDFFRPWLGEVGAYDILSAGLGGVYATDSKSLAMSSLFKNLKQPKTYLQFIFQLKKNKEKTYGSLGFVIGMQELINALKNELKDEIKVGEAQSTAKDNSIICTDAYQAALLSPTQALKNLLSLLPYQKVSSATVHLKKEIKDLERSFGLLFPPGSNFKALGVLNNKAIFSGRVKNENSFSYTFIFPTVDDPQGLLLGTLTQLQVDSSDILDSFIHPWSPGLPQYSPYRMELISELHHLVNSNTYNIAYFGNYTGGISIREIISQAKHWSAKL